MTLNIALRVALGSGIIFTKFDLRQLIRAWIIAFFDADTLCRDVTWTFDLLTLNFYSTSGVMCLNSVQNSSKIRISYILDQGTLDVPRTVKVNV